MSRKDCEFSGTGTQASERHGKPAKYRNSGGTHALPSCVVLGNGRLLCRLRCPILLLVILHRRQRLQNPIAKQSGDLSLHLTLIKTFADGVPLWPDNPIYV